MITPATIEAVRDATDLAELVMEYTPLRRVNGGFVCKCVFHHERTASMHVHSTGEWKNRWKCFGCSAGGNCFDFVMQIEGWSFIKAAEYLAERAGIAIRRTARPTEMERKRSAEDRACLNWWWQQRWEAVRAELDEVLGYGPPDPPAITITWSDDGVSQISAAGPMPEWYAYAGSLGRILYWIEALPRAEKMQHFLRTVRESEREEWRAYMAEEKEFADAWMSLATEGVCVQ